MAAETREEIREELARADTDTGEQCTSGAPTPTA